MTAADEMPVGPCEPWCELSPAAHERDHPNDRRCIQTVAGTYLSLHDALTGHDGATWKDGIDARLSRRPGADTEVWLFQEGPDVEVRMSLEEAAQLRDALSSALSIHENGCDLTSPRAEASA